MSITQTPRSLSRRPGTRLAVTLGLVGLLLGAGPHAGPLPTTAVAVDPSTAPAAAPTSVPRPDHVVVVVLENKDRKTVLGSGAAPYLDDLARRGASMSSSYGVTHPSQPNYVAMFSGSQHGVTTNACTDLGSLPNLASQLTEAGLSFTGYAEALPSVGYTGCAAGTYRRKHNPWVSFANVRPEQNQPFDAFPTDYRTLPTVSFVVPDMCHDMHDCPVATGDRWLRTHLDGYARWARTHNSLLVVTFDENQGGTVNQIATLLVGQHVRPGVYPERMDHYTLLRTLEDAYGLRPLGRAAQAQPLRTIWTTSPAPVTGVRNGTFEAQLSRWARSGSTLSSSRVSHRGARSGRAGSTKATRGDSILSQTFPVPAGRTRLGVWWKGRCADRVGRAWATVILKDNTTGTKATLLRRTCVAKGRWRQVRATVTPGHSYTLRLVSHDDGRASTPNRTYFDDVTLS